MQRSIQRLVTETLPAVFTCCQASFPKLNSLLLTPDHTHPRAKKCFAVILGLEGGLSTGIGYIFTFPVPGCYYEKMLPTLALQEINMY